MSAQAPEEARDVRHVEFEGVGADIDMAAFDDLDLLDMIDDFQSGDFFKFKKILARILGEEQWARVYEGLKDGGRVTATRASEFFASVMEQANAKN